MMDLSSIYVVEYSPEWHEGYIRTLEEIFEDNRGDRLLVGVFRDRGRAMSLRFWVELPATKRDTYICTCDFDDLLEYRVTCNDCEGFEIRTIGSLIDETFDYFHKEAGVCYSLRNMLQPDWNETRR